MLLFISIWLHTYLCDDEKQESGRDIFQLYNLLLTHKFWVFGLQFVNTEQSIQSAQFKEK